MANQKRANGADLWFVTSEGIERDPHVNVAYYNAGSYEWVSTSGFASLSRDRSKNEAL
jgi:general stress protein 26